MSTKYSPYIIKYCVISSNAVIVLTAISIITISRESAYWNSCLYKTIRWLNEEENVLIGLDRGSKESVAEAIFKGAVYKQKVEIK